MPDKWPSAKSLFAVKFFSESSLPRAALSKAFAEGFWAFAECPGPSAKRASPAVVCFLAEDIVLRNTKMVVNLQRWLTCIVWAL